VLALAPGRRIEPPALWRRYRRDPSNIADRTRDRYRRGRRLIGFAAAGQVDREASGSYRGTAIHTVGLKVLKNKLSEYVRLAAAGKTIVVTDRGRAVAEIVPPQHRPESVIERAIREGWIRPAKKPFAPLPPRRPVPGLTLEQLLAELNSDREDRG
jgi:prevent-host-death family protein